MPGRPISVAVIGALAPLLPAAVSSAASASPVSRRRPVTATRAPSRAAARAMPAPRPEVPPLMSTTRSRSNSPLIIRSLTPQA